jgi:hypothetical protein
MQRGSLQVVRVCYAIANGVYHTGIRRRILYALADSIKLGDEIGEAQLLYIDGMNIKVIA